jgi:cadherin 5 type 2 (VE-cadherin)
VTTITTESKLVLEDLYPGAGYEVKVFAISHGLHSEPHDYFQAVCKYALLLHCLDLVCVG